MKIKQVSVGKEFKCGLPNFSNITARCDIQVEVAEGEEVNWTKLWNTVNQQLSIQSDNIDASWIQSKEYKNFFKTIIKHPKQEVK